VSLYVVADLGDPLAAAWFLPVARLLREAAERRASQGVTLGGVALLPDATGPPEETTGLAAARRALQALEQAQATTCLPLLNGAGSGDGGAKEEANFLALFNEGCYLLTPANEDGLAAGEEAEMDGMVAAWLAELLLTPLGLALERGVPPTSGSGSGLGSFGLARCRFPSAGLAAHLAARLQEEMAGVLLAPPAGGGGWARAAGRPPALWPDGLCFPVTPDRFMPPDLSRLRTLRREVDTAVKSAMQDLRAAARTRDTALETALADERDALRARTDAVIDALDGGLAAAMACLESLSCTWEQAAARATQRSDGLQQRIGRLADPLAGAGAELESVLSYFPPWRPAAWLRLLARHWRLLRLLVAYREIGERVAAYLALQQARWLLEAEALEADWQAAFCHRLAGAAQEGLAQIKDFYRGIAGMGETLSRSPALCPQEIEQQLETNALPRGLAGYYYRRVAGDARQAMAALLAVYGPLSRWLAEDLLAKEVARLIGEWAAERFSFLQDEVRFDELLARTYTGNELKVRLKELMAAAQPFWSGDQALSAPEGRTEAAPARFVGLPQPESSPLAELLAEVWPEVCLYASCDPHRITAVQVRRGLSPDALRLKAGEGADRQQVLSNRGITERDRGGKGVQQDVE